VVTAPLPAPQPPVTPPPASADHKPAATPEAITPPPAKPEDAPPAKPASGS
jgi:hypothetical protein